MSGIREMSVCLKDNLCEMLENTLVLKNVLCELQQSGVDIGDDLDQAGELCHSLQREITRLTEFLNEAPDTDELE